MIRTVRKGERLPGIPADTWNAFCAAARMVLGEALDQFGAAGRFPGNAPPIVSVRNDSGARRGRFEILALGDPVVTPTAHADNFKNGPFYTGATPAITTGHIFPDRAIGTIVVLPKDLAVDEVGPGLALGLTVVRLNVVDEGHRYAKAKHNSSEQLDTYEWGCARIQWKEAGTGDKWAVVELGNFWDRTIVGVPEATILKNGVGEVNVYENGGDTGRVLTNVKAFFGDMAAGKRCSVIAGEGAFHIGSQGECD